MHREMKLQLEIPVTLLLNKNSIEERYTLMFDEASILVCRGNKQEAKEAMIEAIQDMLKPGGNALSDCGYKWVRG